MVCNPLGGANACPAFNANGQMIPQGCQADPTTGKGSCATTSMKMNGAPCMFLNDCAPGLGCATENGMTVCREYCSTGASPVACTMAGAMTCHDFSMTIKSTTLGFCGP
jgi:hypothetical protein